LFAEQHWLSRRDPEVLTMLPMVSVENFGIFAMGLGAIVLLVGLVRRLLAR
jgi:hypothetical protein